DEGHDEHRAEVAEQRAERGGPLWPGSAVVLCGNISRPDTSAAPSARAVPLQRGPAVRAEGPLLLDHLAAAPALHEVWQRFRKRGFHRGRGLVRGVCLLGTP